ncbi:SpoIIE family protein phosphatase [Catellatospora sp. KI3]|uniref:SpoIIE family protein phosphatase n=1 Tax=Catellatospora sp. KI3 TaxID=3041620 RepID=UPI00248260E9|nr:SpoIIE family protein phosphatase [Catellatospora sp. KI3]MDI1463481.1 SpoIIE family protein phosphatase [Catellatospora sp. KI3]
MSDEIKTAVTQPSAVSDHPVSPLLDPVTADAAEATGRADDDGSVDPLWALLLNGSEEMIFAVDRGGVVRIANTAAERTLKLRAGRPVPRGPLAQVLQGPPGTFELDVHDRRLHGRGATTGQWTAWYVRDVTEQVMRIDALLAERWRSAFLAEAGRRLGSSLNRTRAARTTALLTVPALADCAVVLLDDDRTLPWYRVDDDDERTEASGSLTRAQLAPDSALDQALSGLTVQDDPRLGDDVGDLLPEGFGPVGSAMVVPLPGHGAPVGALLLARHAGRAPFESAEVHLVRQFAARAGAAISACALYTAQADAADLVRRSLEPAALPSVPGLLLGAAYRPAWERLRISGDFYGLRPGPDGMTWLFVLGDVFGKGIEAAIRSGNVRQSLQALWLTGSRPSRLLELLNRATMVDADPTFATLIVGEIATGPDGGITVTLATGGHPPPLLLRTTGETVPVEVTGTALGVSEQARFGETEIVLGPGDTIVLYTDGVTEARGQSGQPFFGIDRLVEELSAYRGTPAAVIAERVAQRVNDWTRDRLQDDVAVLVIQVQPPASHLLEGQA